MANSSMDRDPLVWLREQLEHAHPDLLREMMAAITEQLMAAEAQEACGAEYGKRSAERVNSRNGVLGSTAISGRGSNARKPPSLKPRFPTP